MRDKEIVDLFWGRDEAAIRQTAETYGGQLCSAAYNILGDREDSSECVNEAYLRLWDSIPPNRPSSLLTYACKIVRRLAIDAYRTKRRLKRGGSEYALSLEELGDICSGGETPEDSLEAKRLSQAINAYVASLSKEAQTVFAQRYYFADPIEKIASCHGMSVSKVKSMLYRARQGLKQHLVKEGFEL